MMEIEYNDLKENMRRLVKCMQPDEFSNQVIEDGGEVFIGVKMPNGIQLKLSFSKTKEDDEC